LLSMTTGGGSKKVLFSPSEYQSVSAQIQV
jgi:hypothetical protein